MVMFAALLLRPRHSAATLSINGPDFIFSERKYWLKVWFSATCVGWEKQNTTVRKTSACKMEIKKEYVKCLNIYSCLCKKKNNFSTKSSQFISIETVII